MLSLLQDTCFSQQGKNVKVFKEGEKEMQQAWLSVAITRHLEMRRLPIFPARRQIRIEFVGFPLCILRKVIMQAKTNPLKKKNIKYWTIPHQIAVKK